MQGSATPGTRAKNGTPEGFAWPAKQLHALANFMLLIRASFSVAASNVTQLLRYFLVDRTFTDVKTFFLVCMEIF